MKAIIRIATCLAFAVSLGACNFRESEDSLDIAIIGESDVESLSGIRLSPAGQSLIAATSEGLVRTDANGDIVPALAERWIVTEDGLSYIFRLRDGSWHDGSPITAQKVRLAMLDILTRFKGTSLGLDLKIITEVRAMAGRVIEIRLRHPSPQFLQLLTQPELGFRKDGQGLGPMRLQNSQFPDESDEADHPLSFTLRAIPPDLRGGVTPKNWEEQVRPVSVAVMMSDPAIQTFERSGADAVFNGRYHNLLSVDAGPLSRGTIRIDPVRGLLGLRIQNTRGILSTPILREALAKAIDRETLLASFNVGGWQANDRIVPLLDDLSSLNPSSRWGDQPLDERRADAANVISLWQKAENGDARILLWLPEGPGSDRLADGLAKDFGFIGVTLERVRDKASADMVLIDRVARYHDPRWFLNQLHCEIQKPLCSSEADKLLDAALRERDTALRAQLLIESENIHLTENYFIPIGAPLRWSLVRSGVDGFAPNQTGRHPLFPLSRKPN